MQARLQRLTALRHDGGPDQRILERAAAELGVSVEELIAEGEGFGRRCREAGLTTLAEYAALAAEEEGLSAREVIAETERLLKRWTA